MRAGASLQVKRLPHTHPKSCQDGRDSKPYSKFSLTGGYSTGPCALVRFHYWVDPSRWKQRAGQILSFWPGPSVFFDSRLDVEFGRIWGSWSSWSHFASSFMGGCSSEARKLLPLRLPSKRIMNCNTYDIYSTVFIYILIILIHFAHVVSLR